LQAGGIEFTAVIVGLQHYVDGVIRVVRDVERQIGIVLTRDDILAAVARDIQQDDPVDHEVHGVAGGLLLDAFHRVGDGRGVADRLTGVDVVTYAVVVAAAVVILG